jgi:hypothetical protein
MARTLIGGNLRLDLLDLEEPSSCESRKAIFRLMVSFACSGVEDAHA